MLKFIVLVMVFAFTGSVMASPGHNASDQHRGCTKPPAQC